MIETQGSDQGSLNQHFKLDDLQRLESMLCPGLFITIKPQTNDTFECDSADGVFLVLRRPYSPTGPYGSRQRWTFNSDASIGSDICENHVITVTVPGGSSLDETISLVVKGEMRWDQKWTQVSALNMVASWVTCGD